MLRSFADSRLPSCLTCLFDLGDYVPTMWKVSHVVPIPKESSKHGVSPYQPIFLLPIISKCLEGDIKKLSLEYLSSNNLLQFGFCANRSTVVPLLLWAIYLESFRPIVTQKQSYPSINPRSYQCWSTHVWYRILT